MSVTYIMYLRSKFNALLEIHGNLCNYVSSDSPFEIGIDLKVHNTNEF